MIVRRRIPFMLLCATWLAVASTSTVSAQEIVGQLLDGTTRSPIFDGVVTLLGANGTRIDRAETDGDGRFRAQAPRAGSYYLRAEELGYRTVTDGIFELGPSGRMEVDVFLGPAPVPLEGVEARVERETRYETRLDRWLENWGFWDRRTHTSGWFITPDDIRERPPMRPRDLFRMIPRVETGDMSGFPGTDGVVTVGCGQFVAYIDGMRSPRTRLGHGLRRPDGGHRGGGGLPPSLPAPDRVCRVRCVRSDSRVDGMTPRAGTPPPPKPYVPNCPG